MTVKNPKALVIDADIARAAGGKEAIYPIPKQCRDFLVEVRSTGHKMVMTPEISAEWEEHQSAFARLWRTQMVTRRQVVFFGYSSDDVIDETLRDEINRYTPDPGTCQIMLKDVHLVEAALVAEQTVTSRDERVRKHFSIVSQQILKLRQIIWVNPTLIEEECIIWLRQGAPADPERKLGKE